MNSDTQGTFSTCTFEVNTAQYGGGGLEVDGDGSFLACTFHSNRALENHGGGVLIKEPGLGEETTFLACTFQSNSAFFNSHGGGVFFNSRVMFTTCIFQSNKVHGTGSRGGGVCMGTHSAGTFLASTFHSNTASFGGSMATIGTFETEVSICTFVSNTAERSSAGAASPTAGSGGGVCVVGSVTLQASFFKDNTAVQGGDAYVTEVSRLAVGNCTFASEIKVVGAGQLVLGHPIFGNPMWNISTDAIVLKGCPAGRSGRMNTILADKTHPLAGSNTPFPHTENCRTERYPKSCCTPCPSGSYAALASSLQCLSCPAGKHSSASSSGSTACVDCAAGRFSFGGVASCTACSNGSIAATEGQLACVLCSAGFHADATRTSCVSCALGAYSLGGASKCIACEAGQYTGARNFQCVDCMSGMFTNKSKQASCQTCKLGVTYQNETGATICKVCTTCAPGRRIAGQSSPQQDQRCEDCLVGRFSAAAANTCTSCIAGKREDGNRISCVDCEAGTYSFDGASMCIACRAGQHTNVEGTQPCVDCASGFYAAATMSTSCTSCIAGTSYQNTTGATICTACSSCPAGHHIAGQASLRQDNQCSSCGAGMYQNTTAQADCMMCDMGTYSTSSASICKSCPAGHSTAIEGAKKCTKCAAPVLFQAELGKSSCGECTRNSEQDDASASACRCTNGYVATAFASNSNSTQRHAKACSKCRDGVECGWTATGNYSTAWHDKVHAKPGFWQCPQWLGGPGRGLPSHVGCSERKTRLLSEVANPMMRKCPHRKIAGVAPPCVGGYDWSACVSTAYEGPLCAACAADHYKNSSAHCVPCGNSQATGIGVLLGFVAFVLLIIGGCFFSTSDAADKGESTSSKAEVKPNECKEKDRWTTLVDNATWAASLYNRVAGEKLKIMLTYGQLLTALTQPEATGTKWPLVFVDFINDLGTIVNLNLFALARSACTFGTTFLSESLVSASTQLTVIGIGLVVVMIRNRAGKDTSQLRQALVFFIFVVYTGLNNTLCAFFKCIRLEDGALHLSEDLRVLCYEGTHFSYVAVVAVFIVIFSLGVPAVLVVILYRARRAGRLYADDVPDATDDDDATSAPTPSKEMTYLGSMFTRYDRNAYWFEAVHLLFKLWFSGVLVVLGNTELEADAVSGVVGDTRAANVLQLVAAMLALLLYLLISGLVQPYIHYGDDFQWMISLSSLLLCAFLAMLRQAAFAELLGVTDETLGALLITFGLVPLVVGVGRLLSAIAAVSGYHLFGKAKTSSCVKVVPISSKTVDEIALAEVSRETLETRLLEAERKVKSARLASLDRSAERERDEAEAREILRSHELEVQASRRQLDLDQQASAARGQRKRFKKRLKYLLKALVQVFEGMADDAIVKTIDKDADGEITYTELVECMQQQSMSNDGNNDTGRTRMKISSDEAQVMLKEMDQDASGTVGVPELLDAIRAARLQGQGRLHSGTTALGEEKNWQQHPGHKKQVVDEDLAVRANQTRYNTAVAPRSLRKRVFLASLIFAVASFSDNHGSEGAVVTVSNMADLQAAMPNSTTRFVLSGTIYVDSDTELDGKGCTLDGQGHQGIMYVAAYSARLNAKNLTFFKGTDQGMGESLAGGVTLYAPGYRSLPYRGHTRISSCTFKSNVALSCCGGGIHMRNTKLTASICFFQSNDSFEGGHGVFMHTSSDGSFSTCTFRSNGHGESGYRGGGGVSMKGENGQLDNDNEGTFSTCTFQYNLARGFTWTSGGGGTSGGGMEMLGSKATFSTCTFQSNSAVNAIALDPGRGGAFYISGSSATLQQCSFEGNSAGQGGDLYVIRTSRVAAGHCIFSSEIKVSSASTFILGYPISGTPAWNMSANSIILKGCPAGRSGRLNVILTNKTNPLDHANKPFPHTEDCGTPDKYKSCCTPCSPGAYAALASSFQCLSCPAGKHSSASSGSTACVDCTAGRYSFGGVASCTACLNGSIAATEGQLSCAPCSAGFYADLARTLCLACAPGTYSLGGVEQCTACEAGQYTGATDFPCVACVSGMFTNKSNQLACQACELEVTYQDEVGATVCKDCRTCAAGRRSTGQCSCQQGQICEDCLEGRFSVAGENVCSTCPAGKREDGNRISCVDCEAGTYSFDGASMCTACRAGQHTNVEGTQPCVDCASGFYAAANMSTSCTSCIAGTTYQNTTGATICKACSTCPAGHHIAGQASLRQDNQCSSCTAGMYQHTTAQADCMMCDMGTYSTSSASICKSCPAGHSTAVEGAKKCTKCAAPVLFQAESGKSSCGECTKNSGQDDASASACRCTNGYVATAFASNSNSTQRHAEVCSECRDGVECGWTAIGNYSTAWHDKVHAKPGFWQCPQWLGGPGRGLPSRVGCSERKTRLLSEKVTNPMMRKCPHRDMAGVAPPCVGGFDWSACVSDAYEGPLCAACAANYYKNSSEHCVPCGNSQGLGIGVLVGLSFVIACIIACCMYGDSHSSSTRSGGSIDGGDARRSKARQKVKARRQAKKKNRRAAVFTRLTWILKLYHRVAGEKLKIMLTYGQLLTALTQPEATGTKWPLVFIDFINDLGTIVNLNLFALARSACTFGTTFLSESLGSASTQLTVISIGLVVVMFRHRAKKDTSQLRQALVFFIFVVYTGLNNTLCAVFKCIRLEDDALHLSEDLRVVCYEGTHSSYVAVVAVFIVIFSLGVPAGLTILLYRARRAGRLYAVDSHSMNSGAATAPTPSKEMAYLGSMFTRYDRNAYWFEAVHLLFKLWFSGVLVVLGNTELEADAVSGVVGDTRAANVLQLVTAMLALLLYLLISGLFQPYVDYGDDVQWMISLSSLLLCAFLAMLRQAAFAKLLGVTDETLGALLITFGLVPLVVGVGRLLSAIAAVSGYHLFGKAKTSSRVKVVPISSKTVDEIALAEVSRETLETRLLEAERKVKSARLASLDRSAERERDEAEAREILRSHEVEVQASRRQLDLDQQASAARGQRKRFKKRLKHLLKKLVQVFEGMSDDAIVQIIDKDADGEITYTELVEFMQPQSMVSSDNSDGATRTKNRMSAEEAQLILKEMDQDSSGTVGVPELLDAIRTARLRSQGSSRGGMRSALGEGTETEENVEQSELDEHDNKGEGEEDVVGEENCY